MNHGYDVRSTYVSVQHDAVRKVNSAVFGLKNLMDFLWTTVGSLQRRLNSDSKT